MAVPLRPQAEAIARPVVKALAVLVALAAVAGCGDDKGTGSTPTQRDGTTSAERTQTTDRQQPGGEETPRSRRDAEVERNLERHLRQEAAGVAAGWTFGDIEAVHARVSRVGIETDLQSSSREAAASLCLAARRFFLQGGQGQTAYDVTVSGRDGSVLAEC